MIKKNWTGTHWYNIVYERTNYRKPFFFRIEIHKHYEKKYANDIQGLAVVQMTLPRIYYINYLSECKKTKLQLSIYIYMYACEYVLV